MMRPSLAGLRNLATRLSNGPQLPSEDRRPTHLLLDRLRIASNRPLAQRQVGGVSLALEEVRSAAAAGQSLFNLPARLLRNAAWAMWQPDGRHAAAIPGFLDAALQLAASDERMLRRLALVWLSGFELEAPAVPAGRSIGALVTGSSTRLLAGWRAAQDRFALFDAESGPALVARAVLAQGEAMLREVSLDVPLLAKGGYMRAVTIALAVEAGRGLTQPEGAALLDRAEAFLVSGKSLRFPEPELRGRIANGLVAAWFGSSPPADALRNRVLAFLREHLGDPRVNGQPWQRASDETRRIVRSWLATITLDVFFRTIGRFSMEAGYEHHWVAREAFWRACLRKNFITDSWLVVGGNVRQHIHGNREIADSYGVIQGGADERHSVLLMLIGQHVFAEWSHNGKLRAWHKDDPRAPQLFQVGGYRASQLKRDGMRFPAPRLRYDLGSTGTDGLSHFPGTWRQRVAEFLHLHERLIIEEHEWQHRR